MTASVVDIIIIDDDDDDDDVSHVHRGHKRSWGGYVVESQPRAETACGWVDPDASIAEMVVGGIGEETPWWCIPDASIAELLVDGINGHRVD